MFLNSLKFWNNSLLGPFNKSVRYFQYLIQNILEKGAQSTAQVIINRQAHQKEDDNFYCYKTKFLNVIWIIARAD